MMDAIHHSKKEKGQGAVAVHPTPLTTVHVLFTNPILRVHTTTPQTVISLSLN
jgi:hypothetical protein